MPTVTFKSNIQTPLNYGENALHVFSTIKIVISSIAINFLVVHTVTFLMHQDGRISYEEFAAMMKAGTDWRKASRQYSRERFNSLNLNLMKDGSLQLANE